MNYLGTKNGKQAELQQSARCGGQHDGDTWMPLPEFICQQPSKTESCSEGLRKNRQEQYQWGGRVVEEALEKDGEFNHIQTKESRRRGGTMSSILMMRIKIS